eukprot:GHVR01104983.1.p1 GENE.GHVR01104983.1~~GHVR01104983.1.p1  ORF type:complete len:129 (+),score=6.90 GHVR01104983.1:169-555(+)
MKKYIFIFLALFCFTTGHASENLKRLSNAPQSITDSGVFREIDFTKAIKYESYHIPFRANPNLSTLQYYFYRNNFTRTPTEFNTYPVFPSNEPYKFKFDLIENKTVKKTNGEETYSQLSIFLKVIKLS